MSDDTHSLVREIHTTLKVQGSEYARRLENLEAAVGGNGTEGLQRDVAVLKARAKAISRLLGAILLLLVGQLFVQWVKG